MQESAATSVPASNYVILAVSAAFSWFNNNIITASPNAHQYKRILEVYIIFLYIAFKQIFAKSGFTLFNLDESLKESSVNVIIQYVG
jgi:hypothetical protein